ncbi:hypothetical protein [Rhodopila sp.]|uniref:hypothetical protein n=1 Tax=Rhodopila sp. TaxID=2480087 RepID=UPI003D14AAC9
MAFSFQSLEALSQAATADMSLTRILRLRGSAVTLSRESAKAERRLGELQTARRSAPATQPTATQPTATQPTATQPLETQPEIPQPRIEKAIALIQDTAEIAATAEASNQTWDQAHEQRQRDARIAASLQRAEARVAALASVPAQSVPPPHVETAGHHPA